MQPTIGRGCYNTGEDCGLCKHGSSDMGEGGWGSELAGSLKVPSHECFSHSHIKFAFGEYIHVHSVVFNVLSVKCSQITKFTLKITL